ncbi:MAG: XdhC/CoxI family protein [Sandaracinaceae bacterium]|nr:XdhC/CoxI family protein [Sandaracinaceae bacterium]
MSAPRPSPASLEVQRALLALLERGGTGALATVVKAAGSTPQVEGARLLRRDDGSCVGTVGGGGVEHAVIELLEAVRRDGRARVVALDLARDLGMCCGGRMEVFVERIEGTPRLVIFGAGHVALAVARVAPSIGFSVTVVDDREELNDAARFPDATRILASPREARAALAIDERDWLLVVTHDHRLDEEALDTYARGPHAYLGMIGSKRKVRRVLDRIRARGPLPPLERVYAPVGLSIGAVSPEEIAISIAAELVSLRRGQATRPSLGHLRHLGEGDEPEPA